MQKTVPETGVTFVDKPHNTIYLNVGGCQVTVTCLAQDNLELYDQVKGPHRTKQVAKKEKMR